MAKKRAPKSPRVIREMAVGIRATPEWKQWLDDFAKRERTTIVDLIDWALEEFAQRKGMTPPPKR